jgi:hypothetical protein
MVRTLSDIVVCIFRNLRGNKSESRSFMPIKICFEMKVQQRGARDPFIFMIGFPMMQSHES